MGGKNGGGTTPGNPVYRVGQSEVNGANYHRATVRQKGQLGHIGAHNGKLVNFGKGGRQQPKLQPVMAFREDDVASAGAYLAHPPMHDGRRAEEAVAALLEKASEYEYATRLTAAQEKISILAGGKILQGREALILAGMGGILNQVELSLRSGVASRVLNDAEKQSARAGIAAIRDALEGSGLNKCLSRAMDSGTIIASTPDR